MHSESKTSAGDSRKMKASGRGEKLECAVLTRLHFDVDEIINRD